MDIMIPVCQVILQHHMVKEFCNVMGKPLPSVQLRLMFDSDTIGVGFGLGFSEYLEIGGWELDPV